MAVAARTGCRLAVLTVAAAAGVWLLASTAAAQQAPGAAGRVAFLARVDNPVDALAASSVAGQLGGIVLLTGSEGLHPDAAAGLAAFDPDVVVLAGGSAALSGQVEADVVAAGYAVRRVSGAGRTATAAALAGLVAEWASPFADDADVAALRVQVDAVTDRLAAAEARLDTAAATNAELTERVTAAEGRAAALEGLLAGVSRRGSVLRFAGMNVQVVNGAGDTAAVNGLGNLVVGYNEDATTSGCQFGDPCQRDGDGAADVRSGSHMLVVGPYHTYSGYAGIVAGLNNTASGRYASVTGGHRNTASGRYASVAGGGGNTASGIVASVAGGNGNTASDDYASVAGGQSNMASGISASVAGGSGNTASGDYYASVAGGHDNTASGISASVAGGWGNTASGPAASVAGGSDGDVADADGSLICNQPFPDA